MEFVFPPAPPASVAVLGSTARFPVHRIYCVGRNYAEHVREMDSAVEFGRNYAEHAREMGAPVERGAPVFFMKPHDAVVDDGDAIDYPPGTADLVFTGTPAGVAALRPGDGFRAGFGGILELRGSIR